MCRFTFLEILGCSDKFVGEIVQWSYSVMFLSDPLFQQLCELVCELLLEESNVHHVSSPVTVCGDIHGQV